MIEIFFGGYRAVAQETIRFWSESRLRYESRNHKCGLKTNSLKNLLAKLQQYDADSQYVSLDISSYL